ncbi:MAG: helix-turn-helix domain-containing protein [Solirubrobacteraceae bacterium]|nr:helix-turn-helix domain-containing protein [Patulibacter sp.]
MTAPQNSPARPLRADARRNRETILGAARDAFAEGGAEISMAEVARRAGVGMATLYRNFPNRPALLEALYLGNIVELARSADDLADLAPGEALTTWLTRFAEYFRAKSALADELLSATGGETTVFAESRAAIFGAAGGLLERAQAAGEIRADITLNQVMDLVAGVGRIQNDDPTYLGQILAVALDGLRTQRG